MHSPVRVLDPETLEVQYTIPIRDNPKAINKVKDSRAKEFLQRRRGQLNKMKRKKEGE